MAQINETVGTNASGAFVKVITSANSATTQTQTTVSVLASSTAVLSAAPTRKSLILQNNDPSTTIYVDLTGGTATTTKGLRLNAGGGSAVLTENCPVTAVTAISTAGPSASNLLVIESF